jgi:uncharacterized protein (DUF1697 family)
MANRRRNKTVVMDKGIFVALLRGINVGGKNKLPMKELTGLFEEVGCDRVRTYIQSGNVVYRAGSHLTKVVPAAVTAFIERDFGYAVPVVTRTAAELAAVVEENPFLDRGADPKTLHVAFLEAKPSVAQVGKLDPERSPGDEFVVSGREVYLHCPNGMARTKYTNAYLDSTLDTVSTMRNWNTVNVLAGWTAEDQ